MRLDIGKNIHYDVVVVTVVTSSFQEQLPSVLYSTISRGRRFVGTKSIFKAGSADAR